MAKQAPHLSFLLITRYTLHQNRLRVNGTNRFPLYFSCLLASITYLFFIFGNKSKAKPNRFGNPFRWFGKPRQIERNGISARTYYNIKQQRATAFFMCFGVKRIPDEQIVANRINGRLFGFKASVTAAAALHTGFGIVFKYPALLQPVIGVMKTLIIVCKKLFINQG